MGHLLLPYVQETGMDPVAREWFAGEALTLGDLVLVVREDQIGTAAMDINLFPQRFHRHRRTLDMPAGTSTTPGALPPRLPRFGCFPEGKVTRVPLAFVWLETPSGLHRLRVSSGKLPIAGKGVRGEIDVAVAFPLEHIRVPLLDELLHKGDNLGDKLGHIGIGIRRTNGQSVHSTEVVRCIAFGGLRGRDPLTQAGLDNPIINIREVLDVSDRVSPVFQVAAHHITGDKETGVTQVRLVLGGQATDIHTDGQGSRNKCFFFTGEGVRDTHRWGAPFLVKFSLTALDGKERMGPPILLCTIQCPQIDLLRIKKRCQAKLVMSKTRCTSYMESPFYLSQFA